MSYSMVRFECLIKEICDYGIPQITDAELLKKYI